MRTRVGNRFKATRRAAAAVRHALHGMVFLSAMAAGVSEAGFDTVYTGASETADKPPKVEFHCRLTPNEKIVAVKVVAGGDELFPKVAQYVNQAGVKTAVLFLIDTSDPKRAKEVALAKKLVVDTLSHADGKRHVLGIYPFHGELDQTFAPMGTPLEELKQKAAGIQANGINTILYGSVLKAIGLLENTEADRKTLVVISDWKSEDNVMGTKEFVDAAVKRMKEGKILCHSVVLVEEDRSELDTAEKLSDGTGGQFVKVTRQHMVLPASFTQGFFGNIENGGTALVDMAGRESADKVVFEVETATGKKYQYTYARKTAGGAPGPAATPAAPDPTPAASGPADAPEPAAGPEATGDQPDTAGADDAESTEDEEESEGFIAGLMDGKELFGVPVWIVLAAIALIVLVLIVIAVMLMRGGDDDEDFDTEFSTPGGNDASPAGAAEPADAGAPPALDPPSAAPLFPEQFDLGNGVALCRTLPGPDEKISATLQFGENAVRGVYPISENKTAVRIGRGSDNDLSFNNDSVSRHHAEILSKRDGSYSITDLDSGNGVYVNGQEITQSALQPGDRVEVGEVVFVFNIES